MQKRSNPNKRRREKAQNKNISKEQREKISGSIYYDPNVALEKKRKRLEAKEKGPKSSATQE